MSKQHGDEWSTPQWLFDTLDKEFSFDLDVCANEVNAKCSNFICKRLDFFKLNVSGLTCFMNPPYSNPKPFIEKAWELSLLNVFVCVVKVDPSTKWWALFWDHESHRPKPGCKIRFLNKRVKFTPPPELLEESNLKGKKFSGPTFPTAIVIMDRRN